jgi:hypothetical protein
MIMIAALAGLFVARASWAQPKEQGVDRLQVLDCGQGHAADQSRWTGGVNVGKPVNISVSCYLIHDATFLKGASQ